jgi:hypothetical protein
MELADAIHELHQKLFYYDWYAKRTEINPILHHCIVAYVHRMIPEVYAVVPDMIGDWQVRVHFVASVASTADAFKVDPKSFAVSPTAVFTPEDIRQMKVLPVSEDPVVEEVDLDVHNECWKLAKICGWQNLEDLFFEVHDGNNAVTQVRESFPDAYEKLSMLYELVGFDVLSEELDR